MMRRLLGAFAALSSACSLFVSLDDLNGTTTDGGGGDSGTDGTTSLIRNGTFDQGAGGCGANWGAGYNETYMRVSPGHTGANACLVCATSVSGSYQIDALDTLTLPAGSYYVEGWIETPDGSPAPQIGIGIQLRTTTDAGSITGCSSSNYCQGSESPAPIGSWAPSAATFGVTGTASVMLDVHSYEAPPGACFVLSDVVLYAQ
jgi:hypothetical protein